MGIITNRKKDWKRRISRIKLILKAVIKDILFEELMMG